MRCFYPLDAWQSASGEIHFYPKGTEGKSEFTRKHKKANYSRELSLPCGQCIGCRIDRSHSWATRCMHEAAMHECNSFVTLTYSEDKVPYQGQLVKSHFQDFMKRLRYYIGDVRYYACGEYGETGDRPHFHAILFGHDFSGDRVPITKSASGMLYQSSVLDHIWSHGFTTIGDVTFESAAYVAGYVIKKRTGKQAADHYMRVDGTTGEIYYKEPEFSLMSRVPGIGTEWLKKYSNDVVNAGGVMVYDTRRSVPRFYETKLLQEDMKERHSFQSDLLELTRFKQAKPVDPRERSYERQRVREACLKAKLKTKLRSL